jgi:fructoselysine-6-P-deglycase FrlB-like protein
MWSEMQEQPGAVARVLASAPERLPALYARLARAELVLLLGRGSSRAATVYGAEALRSVAGRPAFALSPTALGRGGSRLQLDRTLVEFFYRYWFRSSGCSG